MRIKTHVRSGMLVWAVPQMAGPMLTAISPAGGPVNALGKRIVVVLVGFLTLIAAAKGQQIIPPVHLHPCDCTIPPCFCDCRVPREPRPVAQEDVVGTWVVSLSQAAAASQASVTLHSGGTMAGAPADFGVWAGSNGEYSATTDAFIFDEHGIVTGKTKRWSSRTAP
jgi:hypothetical protein